MGTHWEGFSINSREGFLLRSNIFPNQMRPLASPRRARIPKRWAIATPRTVENRGSAHPPAEAPARRDPERQCAGGCRADRQPAAHSPGRPCRGGASAPRWRPCPFTGHPHRPGIASRASRPCRLLDRPHLLLSGTTLAALRSLASQPGPADPRQRIPAQAGSPCRPLDSQPEAGFRRSCCKERTHARPDSRFLV